MTRVLRIVAIAIAVAGVIDPAVTTERRVRPDVVVLAVDDSVAAERVIDGLSDDFRVLRSPFPNAAATVVVGARLPEDAALLRAPVFAVPAGSGARIESLTVPAVASVQANVVVDAQVNRGAGEVRLYANGQLVERAVPDSAGRVSMQFAPTAVGPLPVQVTADGVSADAVIEVRAERWPVLFFDLRPSWAATFARRAIERDPHFNVAHRVQTSREASIGTPGAPLSLLDVAALKRHDAIVIGAADALRPQDVAALERYLRERGGSVILLPEDLSAPAPLRLTGAAGWRAGEVSVGAGRVLVSADPDAWRERAAPGSGFAASWLRTVSAAAAAAPPPIELRLEQSVLRPGAATELSVTMRDVALGGAGGDVVVYVELVLPNETVPVRVWPESAPGHFRGRVRAPTVPGHYTVRVTSGPAHAQAYLRVAEDAAQATPDRTNLLQFWTRTRAGSLLTADTRKVSATLSRTLRPAVRSETWRPMRSPWWLAPFALALAWEWWSRRRRGYA